MHFGPRHHPAAAGVCTLADDMAASRQAKLGFALGWTCFARQLGPWSGRPPRSPDRGLPHRARVPASPFPDTPDPCQPPCVRADLETCASLDQTAASCPALSLSSLARRFRSPRVLGAPEPRPPSLPKGRIPCGIHASRPNSNPCPGARIHRRRSHRPGVAWLSGSPTTVAMQTSCCTFARTFARIRSSRS